MDDGAISRRSAVTVDRAARTPQSTSPAQVSNARTNFNAPRSVTAAAVLYVFRCLVESDVPLNAGCLRPLDIVVPTARFLSPVTTRAAVVAGNVETSQAVTDTLFGALGVLAARQGTMNNFTFGNDRHQYYETICGGAGAGPTFDGTNGRAHPHDELAAHRPGGAGVALPGRSSAVSRCATGSGGTGAHTVATASSARSSSANR